MTPAMWAELEAREVIAAARDRRRLLDAPAEVFADLDPVRFRWGFPPEAPRTSILGHYAATPSASPGRRPYRLLVEGARGSGKTEIAREVVLHRLLDGRETGVLFVGRTPPDSAAHVRTYLDRMPRLRKIENLDDPAVVRWQTSPLGRLYPDARITGGVEHAEVHVNGRTAHLWSRTPAGSIRGLNEGGVRPSLVLCDDLVTLEAAMSSKQTDSLEAILDDDIGGLGTVDCPVAIWLLGNAVAQGDLLDRAASTDRWISCRAPSWTPSVPPDSPHKRELLRMLSTPGDAARLDNAAARYLADHFDDVIQGCAPTDPNVAPLSLLAIEAAIGTRAFRRAYQCERLSADDRLFAMESATIVDLEGGFVRYESGDKIPIATCRAGVWLDPRGIEESNRGDYAAVAICLREPGASDRARRVVVSIDLDRCSSVGQRALLWDAYDRALALGVLPKNVRVGYETNNAAKLAHGTFFAQELADRRASRLPVPPAGVEGAWSSRDKYDIERIGGLEGPLATGRLAFARPLRGSVAWSQFERAPHCDHDDGPDAVSAADALTELVERRVSMFDIRVK